MMRVIAVMNRKGGVGKTTASSHLGRALALNGYSVLLLDTDPQDHLRAHFGLNGTVTPGLDEVLLEGRLLDTVAREQRPGMHLVTAGPRLTVVEQLRHGGTGRGRLLTQAIRASRLRGIEFVIIDCAPSSGLLSVNALFAADEVLIPMSGDYLSMHGLSQMMRVIQSVERIDKRRLQCWIAMTRYQSRRRLARQVRERLITYFPNQVLGTPVRELAELSEAPSFGQTVFEYRPSGGAARDYARLTTDLLRRRTLE